MTSRLVHPEMLRRLERDFFPQTCTIQQAASTLDEYGQELADDDESKWAVVTGLEALACRVAPATGGTHRTAKLTVTDCTHVIVLAGKYPVITTQMRAVVDDQAYMIRLPSLDAEGITTRLEVNLVYA
jgi:hypothetical protein